ncbi:hypothetical protein BpHYR1_052972 [Brachionus plicatilis]|uniref:Uncharacterized protein n=1 Tax=Brachionus plicatilis TaxID=10195 RepID=A0A3M7RVW0_BRAPC|nr:hypothetical protein BpHYR1_052972 [Brachionus plicatilis]
MGLVYHAKGTRCTLLLIAYRLLMLRLILIYLLKKCVKICSIFLMNASKQTQLKGGLTNAQYVIY